MGLMQKILGKLTFPCKEVTEIIETEKATELSVGDKLKFKIHLLVCKVCGAYKKQSVLIGNALSRLTNAPPKNQKKMDAATKQKIWKEIEEEQD